jgi:hypothetical protein
VDNLNILWRVTMTTLRRFRALPVTVTTSSERLIERMRERHGQMASLLIIKAKPQVKRVRL